MSPSVLAIGVPHNAAVVPKERQEGLKKLLDEMTQDMEASPYDYHMLWLTPEDDFSLLSKKLAEKKWDVLLIGGGIRSMPELTEFFERIINTAHKESPHSIFSFNKSIPETRAGVQRALDAFGSGKQ